MHQMIDAIWTMTVSVPARSSEGTLTLSIAVSKHVSREVRISVIVSIFACREQNHYTLLLAFLLSNQDNVPCRNIRY